MVRRTRNGRTGQIFGKTGKTCPPQANPAGAPSVRGFRQWENLFDAELKKPAARIAWRKLTDHHCDPHALKASLFYAAYHLKDAQEVPEAWEAFDRARQTTLDQVTQLKKVLRGLMLLRTQGILAAKNQIRWGRPSALNPSSVHCSYCDTMQTFRDCRTRCSEISNLLIESIDLQTRRVTPDGWHQLSCELPHGCLGTRTERAQGLRACSTR